LRHRASASSVCHFSVHAIQARSTAPPLTIQHCTFQI